MDDNVTHSAVQHLVSILRRHKALVFVVLLFASIAGVFMQSHAVSASMATNSRLSYGNVYNYCNGGTAFAKGMVWLSNQSDYYSETVAIGTNATSVRVSVRGAVNNCRTGFPGPTEMWAIRMSASVLTGLSSNSLYRGTSQPQPWQWTTTGSRLYGNLDVSRVALCSPTNLTGRASGSVTVYLTRTMQQRRWGSVTYTSPDPGTEAVPVNVVRTCPTYNYSLVPSITSVTDGSTLEVPVTNQPITGSVRNQGPTNSRPNIDWQVTQMRYNKNVAIPQKSGGTSAQSTNPCAYFTGELDCTSIASGRQGVYTRNSVQNHPATATINDYPVGTRICFAMSVRQYTHTTENWRHSALSCYVVGKKPKVNIIGGDLYVGRTVVGANSPISTRVVTATSRNGSGTYGSWGEYAIAASGAVTNMASGSGSVNGDTSPLNLLTFANTGNTSARCDTPNGCYTHASTLPDIASRFRTDSSTPVITSTNLSSVATGVYRGSGNITLTSGTIPSGRWIVINAPTATVTIASNIRYTNGAIGNASQIPQVVIIANNITINDNVTQVDAWLVAKGTGLSNGVIRTCSSAPSAISTNTCNAKLTVNGPVIANRLIMLRTAGSGTGAAAGDPAEVFNFRPDAYIWAAQQAQSGGRVTTVSTKELPPRY